MNKQRTIFYISDRTGITSETLGHALLTQFDGYDWNEVSIPFLNTEKKARQVVDEINTSAEKDAALPLVFSTLIAEEMRTLVKQSRCSFYDFFETFIGELEHDLDQPSSHVIGRSHGMNASSSYLKRIRALNFTLKHDDAAMLTGYDEADLIIIGVSRTGKTPTCLYLSMQYGIATINYPLTEGDMRYLALPKALKPYKDKLYGLTIDPVQLHKIRQERRADSHYASLQQCQFEIQWQEQLYQQESISFVDTTSVSIEEISTTILHSAKLKRRLYG